MRNLAKSLSRVISIQNFGSSGSKLVHALLDDHPNILTIPSLYMMGYFDFWPEDYDRARNQVINDFVDKHLYWFDPKGYVPWGTHTMGPNHDESVYVEKEVFLQNLQKIFCEDKLISRKFFFQAVYVAYALSYGRTLHMSGEKYVLVYPHHTSRQEEAIELTKDFPSTNFIHCFREPIQTLASTYKMGSSRWGGFPPAAPIAHTTALVLLSIYFEDQYIANKRPYKIYAFSPILPEYEEFSIAIKLEDLVQNPKEKLVSLCEFINIPWDDVFLSATYNGKTWWNRPESATVTGFSKKPLSRSHNDVLNTFDRYRLGVLMANLKKGMGYLSISTSMSPAFKAIFFSSLFIPLKIELLSIFPTRFSFYKTTNLIKNYKQTIHIAIKNRSLHGTGLKLVVKEFYMFSIGWLSLKPVRSYICIRKILFKALRRINETPIVVDLL